MEISEYRNAIRRPVALPSGLRGFVRAPSVMDLAAYPRLLARAGEGAAGAGAEGFARDWIHCVLRRCFIPERGVMCEKEPGRCLPGELSVHELDPRDAAAILEAVSALEGAAPAAGAPAREEGEGRPADAAFPGGAAQPAGDAPPPGEDLRPAAPPAGAV